MYRKKTTAVIATVAGVLAAMTMTTAASAAPAQAGCSWQLVPAPTAPDAMSLAGTPAQGGSDVLMMPDASLIGVSEPSSGDAWITGSLPTSSTWMLRLNGSTITPAAAQIPEGIDGFQSGSGYTQLASSFDSGTDGWMLGGARGAGQQNAETAEHWDGKAWTMVPLSVTPGRDYGSQLLYNVAALAQDNAWAVGSDNSTQNGGALIEHWDGSTWNIVPNPGSSVQGAELSAVDAVSPDNIWAVGSHGEQPSGGGTVLPFAEHYNGTAWTVLPNPPLAAGYPSGFFHAVSADGSGGMWAAGTQPNGTDASTIPQVALVDHWDGSKWTVQRLPQLPNVDEIMSIYAASPSDVWATTRLDQVGAVAAFLHWDGRSWSTVTAPGPQENGLLYDWHAVSGTGPNDIWAVGSVANYADAISGPTINGLGTIFANGTPQIAHFSCS